MLYQYDSKICADVQSVRQQVPWRKKPLVRAVALALAVGSTVLPASGWAANTFKITGVKFFDSYPATPNDIYDDGENQDSLYEDRASIYFRRIDTTPEQSRFSVSLRGGEYTSPNLFFGTVDNPTKYKIWQPIDNQVLEILGTEEVIPKWSSEETALTIVASEQNGVKSIQVYDGDSLLKKFTSETATIDFPFPAPGQEEIDSGVPYYCGDDEAARKRIDIVLCGSNSECPDFYPNAEIIQVPSPLQITDWDQHWEREDQNGISERIVDQAVAIYGTIEFPLTDSPSGTPLKPIIDNAYAICNYGTLLGKLADNGAWSHWYHWYHGKHAAMKIRFNDVFANFGTIQGGDGLNYSDRLAVDVQIEGRNGNNPSGIFYNAGIVQGGNGATIQATGNWNNDGNDDYPQKGHFETYFNENRITGGSVNVDALKVQQHGTFTGGMGTTLVYQSRYNVPVWLWSQNPPPRAGGKGGNADISPNNVQTGLSGTEITVTPGSITRAGRGGDMVLVNNECDSCTLFEVKGGKGGTLTLNAENVQTDNNNYTDDQSITLEGNSIYIDPSVMLAGKALRVKAEEDVVIFGDDNWQLNLTGLSEGAITAGRNITLAVGEGGTIDLRGVSPKAFKAVGKMEIYADNVLLDEGVQLSDLIDAQEIITGPNKIIYRVVLGSGQQVEGKAGETFTFEFTVYNGGPKDDTYTFGVEGELSSSITGLPTALTVSSFETKKVTLDVKLPSEAGLTDKVIVKAVSSNSSHGAEAEMPILLMTEPPETATLTIENTGEGSITAQGINCGEDCSEDYTLNSEVTLTATPSEGYNFKDWQGDCAGTTAELTVTLDKAKSCTATFAEIPNVPPTAALAITPESGEAALTVALNGSASSDTDGNIVKYVWTSSDGQTATGENAELTFNEAGDYTVTLEITDNDGAINSATKNVKVEAAGNYVASGTLKDKEGNPLAGVTIQIDDKTVVTDETGYWEINGLVEGEYTVIASKDGYLFDTTPCVVSNNVDTCQPKIKGEPLLDVKVVPEPRIAKQGEDVIYTVTVTNQGEGTATLVTLADGLPDNTELVSIEALDGGSCEADTLTCSLPDLTPGTTANVKVVISNHQAKTLLNTVTVTTQEYPTDVKKTWTQVIPYLSVTLTDQPDPIEMLNVLHYSIAVELSHYAPTDASGVTLVSQLPKGVELKSITSDYAVCDTSALPQITCQMTDLSVASADSVSQASVEMDVALQDAGLLLLTHEAKVTANEYPAHTDRERTKIFIPEGIEVDLVFVIDVTGSMQEEMNGVIKALKEFIAEIDAETAPLMALVTFQDEVKIAAFTQDLNVLVSAIEQLQAKGGGTCPEASVEALLVAIPHTKAGGDILFSTDASPYADAEVEKVIELLRAKGIRFNAMITGDCSQENSWNELPLN
jgi:uncharacterized repeat protein (TIGR01451 family)